MPTYVRSQVTDNRRRYPYSNMVKKTKFPHNSHGLIVIEFQDKSTTVTGNGEGTYDAYEEDIAFAIFYFEEPTVFEYTRYVKGAEGDSQKATF